MRQILHQNMCNRGHAIVRQTRARACPELVEGAPAPHCLLRGGGFSFQFGVDGGVGANFVVPAFRPELDREIMRIDLRHTAAAHHDLAEDIVADRDKPAP